MRFCGPDGRWTGSSPKCEEVRCDAPGLPVNGSAIYIGNDRSFKEQSFSVGVTVQYECDYGHVVKGSWSSRLCQANGDWSGEPPICKFVDCGTPPSIENGNYILKHPPAGSVGSATPIESNRRSDPSNVSGQSGTFTYYGTIAHYSCDANYKLQGPAQRECLDSGQWRTPLPTCESVQCPKPEHFDEFTQVSLIPRSASSSSSSSSSSPAPLSTSSDSTTATSGETQQQSLARSIRLIANNQWINHDSSQTFGVGDKLHYSCVPGFELYGGPEIRTCTQYGQWSGSSTPRCRLIDCGRPAPIGQEGRFYLLNESTNFNSLVEYSCVRPFKLVEMKIRQAGNLIETLNVAQAGVTPILTSLPIGVKVCANNGQWMPNDQQPKCVSASSDAGSSGGNGGNGGGQFDGGDNSLDSSQRVQVLAGSAPTTTFIGAIGNNHDASDNNLDNSASGQHHHSGTQSAASTSLWAKIIIAVCLMVMLALIILTLICIRSGKKPKQAHRTSILANGHQAAAAAAAAAIQIQLAGGGGAGNGGGGGVGKVLNQQQQAVAAAAAAAAAQQASMMAEPNVYINGTAHKMFPAQMIHQMPSLHNGHPHMNSQGGLTAYGDASASLSHNQGLMMAVAAANSAGRSMVAVGGGASMTNGGEIFINGRSNSLGVAGDRVIRTGQPGEHPMSMSAINMMDSYSRLSIESELQSSNQQANKTIRHNPNGLVTFVSPAQQQHNRNGQQQQQQQQQLQKQQQSQQQQQQGASSQHQVSPQSISTSLSLSSSSSPSSSSSTHHTTATRLSTTDSASSSSSSSNNNNNNNNNNINNNNNASSNGNNKSNTNLHSGYQTAQQYAASQAQQPSPPSLPTHPPPSHRIQQHHKQLVKQQQQQQPSKQQLTGKQPQNRRSQNGSLDQSSQQQPQQATVNHHYMEPTL